MIQVSDKEQRYFQLLQRLVVTSQETERVTEHYDRIERETQARLEEKQIAAAAAEKDLQALRDEAGKVFVGEFCCLFGRLIRLQRGRMRGIRDDLFPPSC